MSTLSNSLSPSPSLSWFDLPLQVKQLLIAAAETWDDTAQSQTYIQQALMTAQKLPGAMGLDVFVAAYRYFFYKHDNEAALEIATQVMHRVQQMESFPEDWEQRVSLLKHRKEDSNIRLYLNAYAASGLIRARLGELEEARVITARVSEIDSQREFGATTVFHVLTHREDEED